MGGAVVDATIQDAAPALNEFFFLRHGLRLDQIDAQWRNNSPMPYDSPIARQGFSQSFMAGKAVYQHSATQNRPRFVIHSSPFLRCIQTSLALASALVAECCVKPILRIDCALGEWMTPDYYQDIQEPPPMAEMARSALYYLTQLSRIVHNKHNQFGPTWKEVLPLRVEDVEIDWDWDSKFFGAGGEYGEEWPEMHARFRSSLGLLLNYYSEKPARRQGHTGLCTRGDEIIIMVTHGAGCNAMIGAVTGRPVLKDVGLASLSHAVALEGPILTHIPSIPNLKLYGIDRTLYRKISDRYCLLMSASTQHLDILDSQKRAPTASKEIGRSGSWHNIVGRAASMQAPRTGLWTSPGRDSRRISSPAPALSSSTSATVPPQQPSLHRSSDSKPVASRVVPPSLIREESERSVASLTSLSSPSPLLTPSPTLQAQLAYHRLDTSGSVLPVAHTMVRPDRPRQRSSTCTATPFDLSQISHLSIS